MIEKEKVKLEIRKAHNNIDDPLGELDRAIDKLCDEYEALLKAKDKKIERIRTLLMQSNRESVLIGNKIGEGKARSIVAMLFWEAKKTDRLQGYGTNKSIYYMQVFNKQLAMLKDTK